MSISGVSSNSYVPLQNQYQLPAPPAIRSNKSFNSSARLSRPAISTPRSPILPLCRPRFRSPPPPLAPHPLRPAPLSIKPSTSSPPICSPATFPPLKRTIPRSTGPSEPRHSITPSLPPLPRGQRRRRCKRAEFPAPGSQPGKLEPGIRQPGGRAIGLRCPAAAAATVRPRGHSSQFPGKHIVRASAHLRGSLTSACGEHKTLANPPARSRYTPKEEGHPPPVKPKPDGGMADFRQLITDSGKLLVRHPGGLD